MTSSLRLPLTLTALGLAMLTARVVLTRSIDMAFLAWNLGLAWAALGLVTRALAKARGGVSLTAVSLGLLAWLFFPNTIYLVSDLAHANYGRGPMRWCDTAMVGTFGLAGAVLAVACLERFRAAARERLGEGASWALSGAVWLSAGVGVWLGRVRRWNSWDAVLDPLGVIADTVSHFLHPRAHPGTWSTTLVYAAVLAALHVGASREGARSEQSLRG